MAHGSPAPGIDPTEASTLPRTAAPRDNGHAQPGPPPRATCLSPAAVGRCPVRSQTPSLGRSLVEYRDERTWPDDHRRARPAPSCSFTAHPPSTSRWAAPARPVRSPSRDRGARASHDGHAQLGRESRAPAVRHTGHGQRAARHQARQTGQQLSSIARAASRIPTRWHTNPWCLHTSSSRLANVRSGVLTSVAAPSLTSRWPVAVHRRGRPDTSPAWSDRAAGHRTE